MLRCNSRWLIPWQVCGGFIICVCGFFFPLWNILQILKKIQYLVKRSSQFRNSALHMKMMVLLITNMMLSCMRGKLRAFDILVSSNLQLKLTRNSTKIFLIPQ